MIALALGFALYIIAFVIIVFASIILVIGMGYGYWLLSIGMAPVLWILMTIGALVGFVCALKNAIKAARALQGKGVK